MYSRSTFGIPASLAPKAQQLVDLLNGLCTRMVENRPTGEDRALIQKIWGEATARIREMDASYYPWSMEWVLEQEPRGWWLTLRHDGEGFFSPEIGCELLRYLLSELPLDIQVEVEWSSTIGGRQGTALVTKDYVVHENIEDLLQDLSAKKRCELDEQEAKRTNSPFYAHCYMLAFLSDSPLTEGTSLEDLLKEATDGNCALYIPHRSSECITPQRMAKLLHLSDSSINFFWREEPEENDAPEQLQFEFGV